MMKKILLLALFAGCTHVSSKIEPVVTAPPSPKQIQREQRCALILPPDFSLSPFAPLTDEEKMTDWGKEYYLALCFAEDFDLYRAITGFKRALFLHPSEQRELEIQYATLLAYFLGKKYKEVAYLSESTPLGKVDSSFAAFDDLLLILYETYEALGNKSHALYLRSLIEEPKAEQLAFLSAVQDADLKNLLVYSEDKPYLSHMISGYEKRAKSVRKASVLNALLPGAGYWYVEQKQTAITAFLVNSLFLGAAAHFIMQHNVAASIITLSFEGGWYFGGIYGAGLASKAYNEKLYEHYAEQIGQKEGYYPFMMLKYKF